MDITAYTSYDEIRALLGVDSDELEDATIGLPVYATTLTAELRDVSPSLPTAFMDVHAKQPDLRSEDEAWFHQVTQLFAAHVLARKLGSAMPMFSPREMSDGKASAVRFAQDPYRETLARLEQDYNSARARLVNAWAPIAQANAPVPTRLVMFRGVGLATDPITGT